MAVSLALNWNLPASSSLFDESLTPTSAPYGSNSGGGSSSSSNSNAHQYPPSQAQEPGVTHSQLPDTMTPSSSKGSQSSWPERLGPASSSATSLVGEGPHQQRSRSASATKPSRSGGGAPEPKSYAAAASSASLQPSFPAVPMPSYGGSDFAGQAHPTHGHSSQDMSWSPPYSRAPGSPYLFSATQPRSTSQATPIGEDGRRLRTTSGPQKATHLTYNDTLQHYPDMPPAAQTRSAYPSAAVQTQLAGQTASGAPGAGAGGYHPYRRAPRTSDVAVPSSSSSFGSQGPPVLPMPIQAAPLGLPAPPERARALSAASDGTAKAETTNDGAKTSPEQAPLISYSSVVSGTGRTQQTGQFSPQNFQPSHVGGGIGQSHMNSSQTSIDSARKERIMHERTDPQAHARSDSTASSHVSSDQSHISTATASTSTRSGPGGAATTPRKPVPASSPLAHSNRNDESTDTTYAGSDDENTIGGRTTPTPGDKQRRGLSGKLRKALSLSTLQQVEAAAAAPDRAYGGRTNISTRKGETQNQPHSSGDTNGSSGSTQSTSPPRTPDNGAPIGGSSAASITSRRSTRPPLSNAEGAGSGRRSLFNRKFNSSTDNISISSTVSSASMMLRKVGNLGKIARKSNLKGITNMFKDKEDGREGLHSDDFGTLPVPTDEAAAAKMGKKDRLKAKKGPPVSASVSHATVELETSSNNNPEAMTPAASYVRQHQLQMRQQAEAERIAREKAEAEKLAAANALRGKTKSTDDVTEGRQKMIEKEKERLKSKRGWRKRLGVGSLGSSSDAQQMTGLETVPLDESTDREPAHTIPGGFSVPPSSSMSHIPSQLGQSGNFNETSYDSAFGEEELEPPHMPVAADVYESSDDFETDSLRHWGEGIERSRESAARVTVVKGILKNIPIGNDRSQHRPSSGGTTDKPGAGRYRANSYDAPQAAHTSTAVPPMSHISSATPDRVDGVPRGSISDEGRGRGSTDSRYERERSGVSPSSPSQNNIGHHANSSMPTLSLMMHPSPTGVRSVTAPVARKRLVFADAHIYHSTWPAHVYDRRGELATCNRLTPLLAQRIKEELNTFKMEEMAVAPSSRIHTHFFV